MIQRNKILRAATCFCVALLAACSNTDAGRLQSLPTTENLVGPDSDIRLLESLLATEDLAGPDQRVAPGEKVVFGSTEAMQTLFDLYGETLSFRWAFSTARFVFDPVHMVEGQPGATFIYDEYGTFETRLQVLQGGEILATDFVTVSTYRLYSDEQARAINERLPAARWRAELRAKHNDLNLFDYYTVQELGIQLHELESITGWIGNCLNYNTYRLSVSYTLRLDESCVGHGVYIFVVADSCDTERNDSPTPTSRP